MGTALTWLAMLLIPIGSYFEIYVAPELSESAVEHIESQAAAFTVVQVLPFMLGPILLGIAAFRAHTWPMPVGVGLIAAPVILTLTPALPGADGIWLISGTAVLGAALAVAGLVTARLLSRRSVPAAPEAARALQGS